MSTFTKYIQNEEHYSEVISRIAKVRNTLWIGTADIKDVYVKQDGEAIPLLGFPKSVHRIGYAEKEAFVPLALFVSVFSRVTPRGREQDFLL